MSDTITATGTGGFYSTYCANRLPCGVCRIMMCNCPVLNGCGVYPVLTWNPNEVTCDTTKKESTTGVIQAEGATGSDESKTIDCYYLPDGKGGYYKVGKERR